MGKKLKFSKLTYIYMNLKISNKTFYKRHNNELIPYLINKSSLHLFPNNSQNKISENLSSKFIVDLENLENSLKTINKNYDIIVLTDIVEAVNDINYLLNKLSLHLNENGKLILSSVNPKYYLLVKFLELINVKDKNMKFSYIHNKKFTQIANGHGFEFIHSNSKQLIPFKFFGVGSVLNSLLESFLFIFNIGIKTYSVYIDLSLHRQKRIIKKLLLFLQKMKKEISDLFLSVYQEKKNMK